MHNVEVAGQVIGPVLGPTAKNGKGALTVTPDGLAWTFRRGFRNLGGVVPWNLITSWESGLAVMAANSRAYVVYVAYENEPLGHISLMLSVRPAHAELVRTLHEAAEAYLPSEIMYVELG